LAVLRALKNFFFHWQPNENFIFMDDRDRKLSFLLGTDRRFYFWLGRSQNFLHYIISKLVAKTGCHRVVSTAMLRVSQQFLQRFIDE
jgi:hypothetical protein